MHTHTRAFNSSHCARLSHQRPSSRVDASALNPFGPKILEQFLASLCFDCFSFCNKTNYKPFWMVLRLFLFWPARKNTQEWGNDHHFKWGRFSQFCQSLNTFASKSKLLWSRGRVGNLCPNQFCCHIYTLVHKFFVVSTPCGSCVVSQNATMCRIRI